MHREVFRDFFGNAAGSLGFIIRAVSVGFDDYCCWPGKTKKNIATKKDVRKWIRLQEQCAYD
jgi:hypothetical protein